MPWGCFAASRIILLLLRHNIAQELLVDIHMVPQAAISPVVPAYTPLISEAFQGSGLSEVEDPLHHRRHLWRPAGHGPSVPNRDWGKHHTTGVNLQVPAPWPGASPGSQTISR